MFGPKPDLKYPLEGLGYDLKNYKRTVFLKHFITRKNIEIGDYTYYDDPDNPEDFEINNIPFHYSFSKEKLIIGKFCALATKTKFITSSANHKLDGFSTFPFGIFGRGWEKEMDMSLLANKGDTIVGNDVWFGYDSTILPAVKIGSGSIIAAKAVVVKDVPPYAIVAGNPAKIVKMRFDKNIIDELLKISWWNWPIDIISKNIKYIIGSDIEKMKRLKKKSLY